MRKQNKTIKGPILPMMIPNLSNEVVTETSRKKGSASLQRRWERGQDRALGRQQSRMTDRAGACQHSDLGEFGASSGEPRTRAAEAAPARLRCLQFARTRKPPSPGYPRRARRQPGSAGAGPRPAPITPEWRPRIRRVLEPPSASSDEEARSSFCHQSALEGEQEARARAGPHQESGARAPAEKRGEKDTRWNGRPPACGR